jgi:hypothetical protein
MQATRKTRKITVKFFLNQLLDPVINEKGKEFYPLYIQVTYNRKNMQLRSLYGKYYLDLMEVPSALLESEERVLRKIITLEASHLEDNYDLRGLKRKYEVYSLSLQQAIEDYLKPKLRLAIMKTNCELKHVLDFASTRATVPLLQAAAQKLLPDFERHLGTRLQQELAVYEQFQRLNKQPFPSYSFPMVIDWSDGSYKEELSIKGKAINKNNPELAKQMSALIDHAVSEEIMVFDE